MGSGLNESGGTPSRAPAVLAVLKGLVLVIGCGSSTPLVPTGPHPPGAPEDFERVGFAPPPAPVEVLPLQRRDECVWRDGHWEWDGQGWKWLAGAWILPPPDCYYARPEWTWIRSGGGSQLVYRKPRWYPEADADEPKRCAEARACTSLLPEETEQVDVGPAPTDRPQRLPTPR